MARWLASAALTLASFAAVAADGESVRPRSQIVEDLYDAAFVDAERGWVVGSFGSIYRTTDAGRHWQSQSIPTAKHLYGVSFVDAACGWAVGRGGLVLHTDDGERWSMQRSGTDKHLFKVDFVDAREGWAVGDWGVVLHTRDSGATWEDRSVGRDQILYAVDFVDRDHGWIVGEFGTIRHTEDGGATWTVQPAGTDKTFFGVSAASATSAWVVGIDGLVLRTRDGGATWQPQRGRLETTATDAIAFGDVLDNPGLYDVKVRGRYGTIVGDVGHVLRSDDGGETWTAETLPGEWRLSWLRGVSLGADGRGLLVGASGLTFRIEGRRMRFSQAAS